MTPFTFILAVMAAYRVATMLVKEEGPFSMFATIRGRIDPNQEKWTGRGLNCVLCVSVWTSLLVVLAILYLPVEVINVIVFWLAVACGALLLNKWVNK